MMILGTWKIFRVKRYFILSEFVLSGFHCTTCVIHRCTINKTKYAVTVLSGLVNNKNNMIKILGYLEKKSKILVCFAPTNFFMLRNCKCFRIFHTLVLRRSGTAYLAIIFYFQPFTLNTPNITNGGTTNLKTPVLLKMCLDSVVRSLRVCLVVKTDFLFLTGIWGVPWMFQGPTRGHPRQTQLERNRKTTQIFTPGVNQRIKEGKLYWLVSNSIQKTWPDADSEVSG